MKLSKYGFNVALVLLLVPGIARADDYLMTLIGASSAGDDYAARDNSGTDTNSNASTYGLSTSDHNSFAVDYGNSGVVRGHGRCGTRAGTNPWNNGTYETISGNFVDSLTDETGQSGAQYCYCGLDSYTPLNGTATALSGPWVFNDDYGDADGCADACASSCAYSLLSDNAGHLALRVAVFNAYAPAGGSGSGGNAVTTQTYVDNLLSGKQARITTTGTNKLMTFGNGAGATPGSRDIVSTLGTSTTATTVPEVGTIVAGINSKQDTVNGIAGRVMAGTGTAGLLDDKLIYTAPLGFTSSLVTAQTVNSIAADAANNELTCATYATPGNTSSECLLWQINTDSATKVKVLEPKEGTGYCYKSPNGTQSLTACTVENKGEWGAVFPDYTVYGIAMCSSHAIPKNGNAYIKGYVPNVQYQQFIQDEYDTWVANGRPDSFNGAYCYCKITTPSGSRWVGFHYGTPQLRACLNGCSLYCGNSLRLNESSESAFINALYRP